LRREREIEAELEALLWQTKQKVMKLTIEDIKEAKKPGGTVVRLLDTSELEMNLRVSAHHRTVSRPSIRENEAALASTYAMGPYQGPEMAYREAQFSKSISASGDGLMLSGASHGDYQR